MKFILGALFLVACTNKAPQLAATPSSPPQIAPVASLPFAITSLEKGAENQIQWDEQSNIERGAAKKFVKERSSFIFELLQPKIDPYVGRDLTPPKCQWKSLPPAVEESGEGWFAYSMSFYSSSGKVLGLCNEGSNVLKTQYTILFCEKVKKQFVIRYFYPAQSPWLKKSVARCS